MTNYYNTLGVSQDSEGIVIDAAYKALVKKYHPDVWTGTADIAEQKIRQINEAYATLRDKSLRKEYDQSLEKPGRNTSSSHSEEVQTDGKIKIDKSMLPSDVTLDGGILIFKKQKFSIADIVAIEHVVTSTQHGYNFAKTHKGLDGSLTLHFVNSKRRLKIDANKSLFGDLRRYENQKADVDKLNYLANALKRGTFKRRVNQHLENCTGTEVFKYDNFTFFRDGTIVKGGVHFGDLNSKEFKISLGYEDLFFEKNTLMGKVSSELFGTKSINIGKNKDVFLHLLKQFYGISFGSR